MSTRIVYKDAQGERNLNLHKSSNKGSSVKYSLMSQNRTKVKQLTESEYERLRQALSLKNKKKKNPKMRVIGWENGGLADTKVISHIIYDDTERNSNKKIKLYFIESGIPVNFKNIRMNATQLNGNGQPVRFGVNRGNGVGVNIGQQVGNGVGVNTGQQVGDGQQVRGNGFGSSKGVQVGEPRQPEGEPNKKEQWYMESKSRLYLGMCKKPKGPFNTTSERAMKYYGRLESYYRSVNAESKVFNVSKNSKYWLEDFGRSIRELTKERAKVELESRENGVSREVKDYIECELRRIRTKERDYLEMISNYKKEKEEKEKKEKEEKEKGGKKWEKGEKEKYEEEIAKMKHNREKGLIKMRENRNKGRNQERREGRKYELGAIQERQNKNQGYRRQLEEIKKAQNKAGELNKDERRGNRNKVNMLKARAAEIKGERNEYKKKVNQRNKGQERKIGNVSKENQKRKMLEMIRKGRMMEGGLPTTEGLRHHVRPLEQANGNIRGQMRKVENSRRVQNIGARNNGISRNGREVGNTGRAQMNNLRRLQGKSPPLPNNLNSYESRMQNEKGVNSQLDNVLNESRGLEKIEPRIGEMNKNIRMMVPLVRRPVKERVQPQNMMKMYALFAMISQQLQQLKKSMSKKKKLTPKRKIPSKKKPVQKKPVKRTLSISEERKKLHQLQLKQYTGLVNMLLKSIKAPKKQALRQITPKSKELKSKKFEMLSKKLKKMTTKRKSKKSKSKTKKSSKKESSSFIIIKSRSNPTVLSTIKAQSKSEALTKYLSKQKTTPSQVFISKNVPINKSSSSKKSISVFSVSTKPKGRSPSPSKKSKQSSKNSKPMIVSVSKNSGTELVLTRKPSVYVSFNK